MRKLDGYEVVAPLTRSADHIAHLVETSKGQYDLETIAYLEEKEKEIRSLITEISNHLIKKV